MDAFWQNPWQARPSSQGEQRDPAGVVGHQKVSAARASSGALAAAPLESLDEVGPGLGRTGI